MRNTAAGHERHTTDRQAAEDRRHSKSMQQDRKEQKEMEHEVNERMSSARVEGLAGCIGDSKWLRHGQISHVGFPTDPTDLNRLGSDRTSSSRYAHRPIA